ncbi:MAG: glycoside hydrolase family 16 protein [Chloroflexi bacterium]|nr:glycoside hydrolase family 16 protein [Chloroflexota bacterium]OJW01840.1 MAG: hypothetical protein BGO39_28220 [Chloroflexi bacterium 54-19]
MRLLPRGLFHYFLTILSILTLTLLTLNPGISQAARPFFGPTNPVHPASIALNPANSQTMALNQPQSLNLVFSDEFNGSAIDTNKWTTCYWWDNNGCTIVTNNELEWYQPGNVLENNGTLKLQARQSHVQGTNGRAYNYTSGVITTGPKTYDSGNSPKFVFQYGYVEFRAKVLSGAGLWPTLWLLPATMNSLPEIDIMEVIGNDPSTLHMHYHYKNSAGVEMDDGVSWQGPNFSADWHTYAVDWEPNAIVWYVDGVERRRFTDTANIPKEPMYLLANLAVGGDWPGAPNAQTQFPSNFEIDYVRVWQNGPQPGPVNTPTPAPTPTAAPVPTATPANPVPGLYKPVADSAVDSSAPSTNLGASNTLNVDGDPTKVSYLKFDTLALAGKNVTSVKLRVGTTNDSSAGSTDTQFVKLASDTGWDESSLTFYNRPAITSTVLGSISHTVPNSVYDIPLNLAALKSKLGTVFTLAMDSSEGDGLYLYSKESPLNPPQLIITTT